MQLNLLLHLSSASRQFICASNERLLQKSLNRCTRLIEERIEWLLLRFVRRTSDFPQKLTDACSFATFPSTSAPRRCMTSSANMAPSDKYELEPAKNQEAPPILSTRTFTTPRQLATIYLASTWPIDISLSSTGRPCEPTRS